MTPTRLGRLQDCRIGPVCGHDNSSILFDEEKRQAEKSVPMRAVGGDFGRIFGDHQRQAERRVAVHQLNENLNIAGLTNRLHAHGDAFKSAIELDLMRKIKATLDPNGILNPGKVL